MPQGQGQAWGEERRSHTRIIYKGRKPNYNPMDTIRLKYHNERLRRDKSFYWWIKLFFSENDRMPKYRELGAEFGFTRERARQIYCRLAEQGYVAKLEGARLHKQTPWIIK